MEINISKKYKDVVVFNNFELSIFEHKINVILGPSGCGKTTLLKVVANLIDYEGHVSLLSSRISYVFQEDRLFPYLTVLKNLTIINQDLNKVNYFLKAFEVSDLTNKYPHQLSGGEKQRISIIRAYLNESDVILMDEPFKSLDLNLKLDLIQMVADIHCKTEKTIILVTHDLDDAIFLGHYISVLSKKETKVMETIENHYFNEELNETSLELRNKLKKLLNN